MVFHAEVEAAAVPEEWNECMKNGDPFWSPQCSEEAQGSAEGARQGEHQGYLESRT